MLKIGTKVKVIGEYMLDTEKIDGKIGTVMKDNGGGLITVNIDGQNYKVWQHKLKIMEAIKNES